MTKILKTLIAASALFIAIPASAGPVLGSHICSQGSHGNSDLGSSDFTFFPTPTAWDPGANTARVGGHPAPGGATWSIMGGGLGMPAFDDHGANTSDITSLGVAGWGVADYASMIGEMLDVWAAVSGFTNLGQVADGGVAGGAPDGTGGELGDIRIAALPFDGGSGVLAHAYQPGTEAIFGGGGTVAGDVHMDVDENWTDNAGGIDIFTVMLHELGHALGLGHSDDINAIMYPFYGGPNRTLGADDIAGIQALYGSAPVSDVSEPGTLWMFGLGLLALGWARRRA
jgi:hypothetical protein